MLASGPRLQLLLVEPLRKEEQPHGARQRITRVIVTSKHRLLALCPARWSRMELPHLGFAEEALHALRCCH